MVFVLSNLRCPQIGLRFFFFFLGGTPERAFSQSERANIGTITTANLSLNYLLEKFRNSECNTLLDASVRNAQLRWKIVVNGAVSSKVKISN
jgi:hypothetical protein